MLDYCDRVKKNVDLTTYQKPHNDKSEVEGILATNAPAILTVSFKTFFLLYLLI